MSIQGNIHLEKSYEGFVVSTRCVFPNEGTTKGMAEAIIGLVPQHDFIVLGPGHTFQYKWEVNAEGNVKTHSLGMKILNAIGWFFTGGLFNIGPYSKLRFAQAIEESYTALQSKLVDGNEAIQADGSEVILMG